ncbi:MAG: hypothetical protein AAFR67_16770, partial [Chloroflexota bacterium]
MTKTKYAGLWDEILGAEGAIVQHLIPAVREAIEKSIFNDVPAWGLLTLTYLAPEKPLTVEQIKMRNPYGNPAGFAQHIKDLQEAGLLDDKAIITQDAYYAYQSLIDTQDAKAATLTFMLESDLQTVIDYLDRIDQAAAGLNTPIHQIIVAEKPCDTPAHRIYELISHLRAFRDDAHVQVWQPLG